MIKCANQVKIAAYANVDPDQSATTFSCSKERGYHCIKASEDIFRNIGLTLKVYCFKSNKSSFKMPGDLSNKAI